MFESLLSGSVVSSSSEVTEETSNGSVTDMPLVVDEVGEVVLSLSVCY